MLTENAILTIIATLPNLAIAVWVIWRDSRTINTLLENNQKLIDQLMALHPPQDEDKA